MSATSATNQTLKVFIFLADPTTTLLTHDQMVVQIDDRKLDCSVSHRLRRLREALSERASREIHAGQEFFEAVEGG